MLKSLKIKNYAIIDDLELELGSGFNVFTGETGAGKSIIVGALSLLFKGRSDPSIIKKGADKAIIEGVFEINDPRLKDILDDQDIEYEDELIIRRTISKEGKSTVKLNQSNVTLNFLTELISPYVDIHSQKDSQYLLNSKNQFSILDKYAFDNDRYQTFSSTYNKYQEKKKDLEKLQKANYSEREIEFLQYDLKELEDAGLSIEEENDLIDKENFFKQSEKILNNLNQANSLYHKDGGVKENFYEIINLLNIDNDRISNLSSKLNELYYDLDDKFSEVNVILSSLQNDDINLDYVEERLYLYSKLKRKHKCDTAQLISKQNELKNILDEYENIEENLIIKQKEMTDAYNKAYEIANNLSKHRKEKALELEKRIKDECVELLLPNCEFKIIFDECELNNHGIDDIEFHVSMNKGEDLKPLKNVASGGEISRLMLALKTVFARLSDTKLLIFDEIDTGVSGKVAFALGQKMKLIAKDCQVLCITHLAPVAACGKCHFYIYKQDNDEYSYTNIKLLNKKERIEELAMISSSDVNEKSLAAAEELLKDGQGD